MRATACPSTRRERSSRRSPGRNPVAHPNAIARADETPAERDPAPGARVALDGRDGAPTRAPCRARAGLARRASRRPPRASGRFIRPLPRARRSHLSFRAVPLTENAALSSRLVPTGGCHRWPRSPPRPPRVYRREAAPPGPARGTYANRLAFAPRVAAPRRAKAQVVLGFRPSETRFRPSGSLLPAPSLTRFPPRPPRLSCAPRASSSPAASSALAKSTITSSACA